MSIPWWVGGAEVHKTLDVVATFASLANIRVVDVDNTDGFCIREQLYFDGLKVGINKEIGKRLRKIA